MSIILLIVSKPKKMTPKVSQDWTKLETIAKESVEDCEGVELIGDSSISVRDKDGLYPFALVLVVAHELNFSYRVDLFDGKESWNKEADA